MRFRPLILALAALAVVSATTALDGCSKNKGTNPMPTVEAFASPDPLSAPFSHTFNTVGSFGYVCTHHAGMAGTIIVNTTSPDRTGAVSVGSGGNLMVPDVVTIKIGGTVTWTPAGGGHNVVRR